MRNGGITTKGDSGTPSGGRGGQQAPTKLRQRKAVVIDTGLRFMP